MLFVMCARSPVDRTLASGAEGGSSTLPERTSKSKPVTDRDFIRRYQDFLNKCVDQGFEIVSSPGIQIGAVPFDIFHDGWFRKVRDGAVFHFSESCGDGEQLFFCFCKALAVKIVCCAVLDEAIEIIELLAQNLFLLMQGGFYVCDIAKKLYVLILAICINTCYDINIGRG